MIIQPSGAPQQAHLVHTPMASQVPTPAAPAPQMPVTLGQNQVTATPAPQANALPAQELDDSVALAIAGVSSAVVKLSGDTFHQIKAEFRKMARPERLNTLAQLQMRIAALYALENEDTQRQVRQEQQERRYRQLEDSRRQTQNSQAASDQIVPQNQNVAAVDDISASSNGMLIPGMAHSSALKDDSHKRQQQQVQQHEGQIQGHPNQHNLLRHVHVSCFRLTF